MRIAGRYRQRNDDGRSRMRRQQLNVLEQYKFRDALFKVIDLARKGNKYLQEKEPWKKAGTKESNTTERAAKN